VHQDLHSFLTLAVPKNHWKAWHRHVQYEASATACHQKSHQSTLFFVFVLSHDPQF